MARYFAASDNTVRDSADENRPVQCPELGGPMVFGNVEDALWYASELNKLHRPAEILAMARAGRYGAR